MTDTTAPTTRRVLGRWGWEAVAPYVAFVALSMVLVGWVQSQVPYISPVDEMSQLDYLVRFPDVPGSGDVLGKGIRREGACRGLVPDMPSRMPPCDAARLTPGRFPGEGYSYSGATPPLYYAVTAAIARPIAAVTPATVFQVARWCGSLWLAGLMSIAYLVALRLGLPRLSAAASAVLVSSATGVVVSAGTVGPDVATAVTGGVVVLAALHFDGTRRGLLLVLAATALAAATKLTTFPAVGAAMFVLALGAVPLAGATPRWRPRAGVGAAAASFAVFGVVSAAWGVVYTSQQVLDPDQLYLNKRFMADRIPWAEIWEAHLIPFLTTTLNNWEPASSVDEVNRQLELIVVGLLILALLVLAASYATDRVAGALGMGALILAVSGPFMLLLLNFHVNGLVFGIVPRYGFGLLPVYAAALAWLARERGPGRAVAVLAVLSVANLFT